jgi:hypothetical protein
VSPSKPVRELRTIKKSLLIDSADRDSVKYYTNGDIVYYLPRVYENVVCIRLKSATFTPVVGQDVSAASTTPILHKYSNGANIPSATWSSDTSSSNAVNYILLDIEGLNKCDETAIDAQRSTLVDSYFARIPVEHNTNTDSKLAIYYNDHTHEENVSYYTPAIRKLDRLHIVTRLHEQQGDNKGFIYWTTDGAIASQGNRSANYSLVLELTMLENSFDDFSSFETRISTRADTSNSFGHFGC